MAVGVNNGFQNFKTTPIFKGEKGTSLTIVSDTLLLSA